MVADKPQFFLEETTSDVDRAMNTEFLQTFSYPVTYSA